MRFLTRGWESNGLLGESVQAPAPYPSPTLPSYPRRPQWHPPVDCIWVAAVAQLTSPSTPAFAAYHCSIALIQPSWLICLFQNNRHPLLWIQVIFIRCSPEGKRTEAVGWKPEQTSPGTSLRWPHKGMQGSGTWNSGTPREEVSPQQNLKCG